MSQSKKPPTHTNSFLIGLGAGLLVGLGWGLVLGMWLL